MVVHLPIGFLFIAVALEILSRKKRYENLKYATGFVLMLTSLSSIIAAILGYFLSQSEGYEEEILAWHKWFGIAVAAISTFAWIFKMYFEKRPSRIFQLAYTTMLITAFICLIITGHGGGSLTHGSDYLVSEMPQSWRTLAGLPAPQEPPVKTISNISEAVVYADIIQPILDKKCVGCHGRSKKKGGLMLTTKEHMLKGGKNGQVVKPGVPEDSKIYTYLLLPEDDDKRMPPKGKTPLNKDQISLIYWWIHQGADFEKKVAHLTVPDSIKKVLTKLAAANAPPKGIFARKIRPADSVALATAAQAGLLLTPIAFDVHYLKMHMVQNKDTFGLAEVNALRGLSEHIAWIDLKGKTLLPVAVDSLAKFRNLTRLQLANTNADDAMAQQLSAIKNLEYLNLYGTAISDVGLRHLASLKNLGSLYVWQTKVSSEEAERFRKASPAVQVNFGAAPK